MTWKVRGRSSSQTPEPVEHADASRATISSMRWLHRLVRKRDQDQRRWRPPPARRRPGRTANALGRCSSPSSGSSTCAVCEVRNGCAKAQAPAPVAPASSRPAPIQRDRPDRQPLLGPARAAGHVLQDDRDREGQAGDEAAARQVVAAQQQVDREHAGHREHQAHDHRRHQQVVASPRPAAAAASPGSRARGGSGAAARRRRCDHAPAR